MVNEEQEEEYEALEAIYPEIERFHNTEADPEAFQPLVFAIDLASETEENQLRLVLNINDFYGSLIASDCKFQCLKRIPKWHQIVMCSSTRTVWIRPIALRLRNLFARLAKNNLEKSCVSLSSGENLLLLKLA